MIWQVTVIVSVCPSADVTLTSTVNELAGEAPLNESTPVEALMETLAPLGALLLTMENVLPLPPVAV